MLTRIFAVAASMGLCTSLGAGVSPLLYGAETSPEIFGTAFVAGAIGSAMTSFFWKNTPT